MCWRTGKGGKKPIMQSHKQKIAQMAITISNKINFQTKIGTRDKGHLKMIKGSVHQKDINIKNI